MTEIIFKSRTEAQAWLARQPKAPKIVTSHIFPPIPDRRFDWCAYRDGAEEQSYTYGYGRTEREAIDDMLRLEHEEWEGNLSDEEHAKYFPNEEEV